MPDEEAFSLLVRLMSVYDLQGHFLPEMPRLQLRLVSRVSKDFGTTNDPMLNPLVSSRPFKQGPCSTTYLSI